MKSIISATAANRFRTARKIALVGLGLIAPLRSFAEQPYCVAVNGGFGNGGTTYVARNFTVPTASKCSPWAGYTKTAAPAILFATGTSCLSTDGTALTVSLSNADPDNVGAGKAVDDYIKM